MTDGNSYVCFRENVSNPILKKYQSHKQIKYYHKSSLGSLNIIILDDNVELFNAVSISFTFFPPTFLSIFENYSSVKIIQSLSGCAFTHRPLCAHSALSAPRACMYML